MRHILAVKHTALAYANQVDPDAEVLTDEIRWAYAMFMNGFRVAMTVARLHPEVVHELADEIETDADKVGFESGWPASEMSHARHTSRVAAEGIVKGLAQEET